MKEAKYLILAAVFAIICAFPAFASVEVGISPDPYSETWEKATERDYEALRCVIYWESAECACPEETMIAICETVLNRAISGNYPEEIYGVCADRKYGRQFYLAAAPHDQDDKIMKAIEKVKAEGRTVLPDYSYVFFATKKQSIGRNHVWIGARKANGEPKKGFGMYFCRGK